MTDERLNWLILFHLKKRRKGTTDPSIITTLNEKIENLTGEIRSAPARRAVRERSYGYSKIIKEYGIDGYLEKIYLPERIHHRESAEAFFLDTWYCRGGSSMYDCTGESITFDYKIALQGGRYVVYHDVRFDV